MQRTWKQFRNNCLPQKRRPEETLRPGKWQTELNKIVQPSRKNKWRPCAKPESKCFCMKLSSVSVKKNESKPSSKKKSGS